MGTNRFEDILLKFETNLAGYLSSKKQEAEQNTNDFMEEVEIIDLLKDLKLITEYSQNLLTINDTLWGRVKSMKEDIDAVKLANVLLTEEVGELIGIAEDKDDELDEEA